MNYPLFEKRYKTWGEAKIKGRQNLGGIKVRYTHHSRERERESTSAMLFVKMLSLVVVLVIFKCSTLDAAMQTGLYSSLITSYLIGKKIVGLRNSRPNF